MNTSAGRLPELDGIRGIAVLMVLIWHFIGSLLDPKLGNWAQAINWLFIFGRTGVDLFFVLSGFLIIGILVDNRTSPRFFRTFYTRRIARIVPPYVLLMALYWTCYVLTGPNAAFNSDPTLSVQLAAQALFAFNWLMAYEGEPIARGFSVTWSVAIEEQFYLLFPLIVWLTPPRHLRSVLLGVGVASAIARAGFYFARPDEGLAAYILTPFRLDCLCVGGLVAMAWRDERLMNLLQKYRGRFNRLVACFALAIPALLVAVNRDLFRTMHLWGHAYLSLLYGLILLAVLLNLGRIRLLTVRPLREAGRLSYSLYLFHPLFLSLVFHVARKSELVTTWSDVLLTILAALLTVVASTASYAFVERYALRWGHRSKYFPNDAAHSPLTEKHRGLSASSPSKSAAP